MNTFPPLGKKKLRKKKKGKKLEMIYDQYGGRTHDLGVNIRILAPRSNQLS
jgi:hypothetical protein